MSRNGLVAVKRMVTRNGKTHMQTVWIKAKHENKVDNTKNVDIPEWDFKDAGEFASEVARINKINDRSERQILKESLIEHVEKEMGLKWDKVPDSDERAFVKNSLRAFSAAKKHLTANPKTAKQKAPDKPKKTSDPKASNSKSGVTVTKQPGTSYVMERDASKKLAREVRDKHGMSNLVQILKDNGITWDEVPEAGPNNMRALRALASFIRKGGELGAGNASTNNDPKLVISDKDKKIPKKSKYEVDSIQYDYENASPKQKAIGLATGIIPSDPETADYLESLIKSGQMTIIDRENLDYNLPSSVKYHLIDSFGAKTDINKFYSANIKRANFDDPALDKLFSGTPYEKDFKSYKKDTMELKNKWGNMASDANYGKVAIDTANLFDKIDKNWGNLSGRELLTKTQEVLENTSNLTDTEVNKLWDDLGLTEFLSKKSSQNGELKPFTPIETLLVAGAGSDYSTNLTRFVRDNGSRSYASLNKDFIDGKIDKREFLGKLGKGLENVASLGGNGVDLRVTTILKSKGSRIIGGDLISNAIAKNGGDFTKLKDSANEFLSDVAKINTPGAAYVATNIALKTSLDSAYSRNRTVKAVPYELINKEEFDGALDFAHLIKTHAGALRLKTDKARAKLKADLNPEEAKYADMIINGADYSSAEFPGADKVKDKIKASLAKVSAEEQKKVQENVAKTHDKVGHRGFTTKVHGVYRIKRIASEDKFQEINAEINNAGHYYHGTSFDSCQKILGVSGGFKVFKAADSDKIKAGSMLGYGIYLAKQSSKSMQYVGNGFRQGSRGVLFHCKASLGNVVQSSVRGFEHNNKIMNDSKTNTVFMDAPHVVNPEWATKEAEQVVPRLWIDAERVKI